MENKKRKIWIFPLPVFIAILVVLFGGGALIYALTRSTEKAGPVGYWKFDEGSGYTAYDASGNFNNGALSNFNFDQTSGWAQGKVAGALQFDGTNDYVDCGTSTTLQLTQWTFEMWVYRKTDSGDYERLLGKSDSSALDWWFLIHNDDSLNIGFKDTGDISHELYGSSTVATTTWSYVAGTFDGTYLKIYVNGELKKTSGDLSAFTPRTSNKNLWIGRNQTSYSFNGNIDEVKIYSRALSAAEVAWNYNRGGPIAWWKFDEGTGSSTVAYDSSGNGNNGTIYGASSTEGKINSALSFDGTSDYVDCGNSTYLNLLSQDDFTIEMWAKLNVTNDNSTFFRQDYNSNSRHFAYWSSVDGEVYWMGHNASEVEVLRYEKTWALSAGTWYFLTFRRTGDNLEMLVDLFSLGVVTDSDKPGNDINKTYISENTTGAMNGSLDDVRIYNYARTAAEIRTDYNAGFAAKFGGSYDLSHGLIGYWDFDEGQGSVAYDGSTNANNGTLTSFDFNQSSGWAQGKVAGGLKFDGTDDYVSVADDASLQVTQWTFAMWVYRNVDSGGYERLIGKSDASALDYWFLIHNDDSINVGYRDTGNVTRETYGSSTVPVASWNHVVGTFDGTYLKTYLNGALMKTSDNFSANTPRTSSKNLWLGRNQNDYTFNGSMDDVRIYNRALSADEVRYLYNRKGPIGYWKFDEGTGSGTVAYDSSGNGNNGTIYGASSTAGKINSALSFDGVNDYVDCGSGTVLDFANGSAWSVAMWAKPSSSANWQAYIGRSNSYLMFHNASEIYFRSINSNYYNVNIGAYAGLWQHIVVTVDTSGNMNVYRDGTLKGTVIPDTTQWGGRYIGYNPTDAIYFNGLIDDIRIYNYARTAAEIRTDYNEGFAVKFGGSYDLSRGLVGYWKFSEGQGATAYDSSGSANNGALTNFNFDTDSGWTTGNTSANTGGALKFDGSNDYVDIGDVSSLQFERTDPFTFSAWVKTSSNSISYPSILTKSNTSSPYTGYWFRQLSTTGELSMQIYDSAGYYLIKTSVATINNGAWRHVVTTYDGNSTSTGLKLYIDGVLAPDTDGSSYTLGNTIKYSTSAKIGGTTGQWAGSIDEVRIYNRALSEDEIRYLYNRKQPVAHWKFDEGAGQYAYDSSINGNTGTVSGASSTEGKIGRALSFDGADDYVDIPKTIFPGLTQITVEAWIKSTTVVAGGVVMYENAGWSNDLNFMVEDANGSFRFGIAGTTQNTANGVITANNWIHLAATFKGSEYMKVYKDGVLINEWTSGIPSAITTTGSDGTATVGARDGVGAPPTRGTNFNGVIDDVRIYNYARNVAEIRADYNAGMSTYFK